MIRAFWLWAFILVTVLGCNDGPASSERTSSVQQRGLAAATVILSASTAEGITVAPGSFTTVYGEEIQLVAAGDPVARMPDDFVEFRDGAQPIGGGSVDVNGQARATISSLGIGVHPGVVAVYYRGASPTVTQALSITVTKAKTTLSVASSNASSVYGEPVTYTATITPVLPGGGAPTTYMGDGSFVIFEDDYNGTGFVPVCNGFSTYSGMSYCTPSVGQLLPGTHVIRATFTNSSQYLDSDNSKSPLNQGVAKALTTTAVTSSANPEKIGQTVTFTATVIAVSPGGTLAGSTTPSGTVVFSIDGGPNLPATVNGSGVATLATSTLTAGSHTVTGTYSADANYAASSASLTGGPQMIGLEGTTVMIASSSPTSAYGDSVTFTATVATNVVGGGTSPTGGTVDFYDGNTLIVTSPIDANHQATWTTSALGGSPTAHTIKAQYSGDPGHAASMTATLSQTVDPRGTTTVVTGPPSSAYGDSVTFTATVSHSGTTPSEPIGTVAFFDGTTELPGSPIDLVGTQAAITVTAFSVGAHTIKAVFGPSDTNFATSQGTLPHAVAKASTKTSLIASANPIVVGGNVVFTATVTGPASGSVSFFDGATLLGKGDVGATGVATYSTSTLTVGTHPITAAYEGNTNYAPSAPSSTVAEIVNQDGVTVTLGSAPNPSAFGANVTFSVSLAATTGGTPTGTVTFSEGTTVLATTTLAAGATSFSTSTLGAGTHMISALYNGDTNHVAGSSAFVAQVVDLAPTTTTLASSLNPSVTGQPVTLTATVTSKTTGALTGTIVFTDGGSTLGTATVAAGVATLTTTFGAGTHALSAAYGGNTTYGASTGPLSQVAGKGATTIALVSSSNPSPLGSSVTFTATVKPAAPAAGAPSGSVTFKDGGALLGTGNLGTGGVATFAAALSAGDHTITAEYAGDPSFNGSISAALVEKLSANAAAITLTTAPDPSAFGAAVTLSATVSSANGIPTGAVVFTAGAATLGTGTLASGKTSITTTALPIGTSTITATYSGDAAFSAGTGTASHVVGKATTSTTLVSSANPSVVGQSVTFTATVASAGGVASGDVEVFEGTTSLGTATLVAGVATLTTSTIPAGAHALTVAYKGNATFEPSTSALLTQQVDAAASSPADDAGTGYGGTGTSGGAPRPTFDGGTILVGGPDDGGCAQSPASGSGGIGLAGFLLAGLAAIFASRRRRR